MALSIKPYIENKERIHLIGIGGVSMNSLGELLLSRGVPVSGSDRLKTDVTARLEAKGAKIAYEHKAENVEGASLIVRTAAVHDDNPEIARAHELGIPVMERAEAWGHLMRDYENVVCLAGTHGKTTSTSMMTLMTMEAQMDPTVMVGSNLPAIGGTLRIGGKGCFVAESCEYCNSFLSFAPTVAVVLNIEEDHLDFFGTFERYAATKSRFIKPDYCKLGIVNADDETGLNIVIAMQNCAPKNFQLLSYGLNNPADNFATNIKYELHGTHYFLNILDDIACINTKLIGEFNVYNALAAASACRAVGADMQAIKLGLNSMEFVAGRINVIRLPNGASVVIDYAHTPDGLENILSSVRNITKGKMYSVFGCGGNRDKSKRAVMGEISGRLADFTVLTSDNPRLEPPEAIIDDIKAGISKVSPDFVCIPDRVDAIHYVLGRLGANDVAVLAGKGAEDYLDIGGRKIHYSEFETVENESRKIWHEVQKC